MMEAPSQSKSKGTAKVIASRPLKVVLPFRKTKTPSKSPKIQQLKLKKKQKATKNLSSLIKTPPLHSSTPKPIQKSVSLPAPLLNCNRFNLATTPLLEKELRIVLERIQVDNPIQSKLTVEKAVPRSVKKQRPKEIKKHSKETLTVSTESLVAPNRISKVQERKETSVSTCESYITTQIPSEILENFGIFSQTSKQSSPTRSRIKNTSDLIETPPRTSITCDSVNCVDPCVSNEASAISSDESFVPDLDNQETQTQLLPTSKPKTGLNNFLEHHENPTPNVYNTSQGDSLTNQCNKVSLPRIELGIVSTHCELLYGLVERLYFKPETYHLDELNGNSPDVRLIAPYALKLDTTEDEFFLFAAPVSMTLEKYCCIVFGILNSYMIAYGGHFIVSKDRLYDPIKKEPVEGVKLTNPMLCRQHLSLLNVPNKTLLEMKDYVPQASHSSYHDTLLASLEIFVSSIDQVKLKEKVRNEIVKEQIEGKFRTIRTAFEMEMDALSPYNSDCQMMVTSSLCKPRVQQVFTQTCLIITDGSLQRIKNSVNPVETLKSQYGDLASMIVDCADTSECHTPYYAAYEAPGCVSFYQNVFVLGHINDHYVVGVVKDRSFFIMATTRLYSRFSLPSPGMQPVKYRPEMLEMIHLPLWISYEHSLTMLEARQILRHPNKYGFHQEIAKSLGITEISQSSNTSLLRYTEPSNHSEYISWLEQMLEHNFSSRFRDSLYKFPSDPTSSTNPFLFVENLIKLWVHQLMRRSKGIDDASFKKDLNPSQIPLCEFFKLDASTFISYFLPLFGMSGDFNFQCLRLGQDGMPASICLESLPARQIGLHIYQCHTLPLLMDANEPHKILKFIPFTLVFQHQLNPPLSDSLCDYDILCWARSVIELWSKGPTLPYLELLKVVGKNELTLSNQEQNVKRFNKKVASGNRKQTARRMPQKRRHTSEEDGSRNLKRHHQSSELSESSN